MTRTQKNHYMTRTQKPLIYRNVADTSDYLIVRAGNNYTTTDPYISFRTHVGVGFHDDSGWNTGRLDMPNYIYENNLPLSNISKYEHLLGEWRSKTDKYYNRYSQKYQVTEIGIIMATCRLRFH